MPADLKGHCPLVFEMMDKMGTDADMLSFYDRRPTRIAFPIHVSLRFMLGDHLFLNYDLILEGSKDDIFSDLKMSSCSTLIQHSSLPCSESNLKTTRAAWEGESRPGPRPRPLVQPSRLRWPSFRPSLSSGPRRSRWQQSCICPSCSTFRAMPHH